MLWASACTTWRFLSMSRSYPLRTSPLRRRVFAGKRGLPVTLWPLRDYHAELAGADAYTRAVGTLTRACGRAGCPLQGIWTEDEICGSCSFPTRKGADAEFAVRKRSLLNSAGTTLPAGELPSSFGYAVRQARLRSLSSHPDCGRVAGCTVVGGHNLKFNPGTHGVLTCGTDGIAFWLDEGLGLSWRGATPTSSRSRSAGQGLQGQAVASSAAGSALPAPSKACS